MAMNVDVARGLLVKWLPRFGFENYRWELECLPTEEAGKCWARCAWAHESEAVFFQFVPDGVLPFEQMEALVLHELAHGLLSLSEESGPAEERVCNRIAKLLVPSDVKLPNHHTWSWDEMQMDETVKPLVRVLIDDLPDNERDALNRYYYESLSYGDIAREMGLSSPKSAERLVKRAGKHLRRLLEDRGVA